MEGYPVSITVVNLGYPISIHHIVHTYLLYIMMHTVTTSELMFHCPGNLHQCCGNCRRYNAVSRMATA